MKQLGKESKVVDYDCEVDSEEMRTRMKRALVKCMRVYPFYGTIALSLRIMEVEKDSWIKTAAVDGTNLFYNKNFVAALDNEELVFLYAHEVLHIVLKHLTRRGNRDARRFNAAGDFYINLALVQASVGKFPTVGGLYEEKYDKMSTEEIYRLLDEDNPPKNAFDDHFEVSICQSSSGEGDEGGDSSGDGTLTISQDVADQIDQETTARIVNALANAKSTNTAGQIPAGIRRMIEELTESVVPWRRFVMSTAMAQIRSDYTYARPNRRTASLGVVLPTLRKDEHFEFTVGIDTSGSISTRMLQDFIAELYFISTQFRSFKMGVFQYDTRVYGYKEFTRHNIEEMLEYEIKGGGGTDYNAAYDFFRKNKIVPKTYINLTDGYPCSGWGDENYCRAVFLIHDEHAISTNLKAPFGTTLYYNDFK